MKQIINPQETTRAAAFEMWMKSPMPMVTLGKTYDVTRLRKVSQRKGLKFNMLMSWCIGQAASQTDEFYLQIDSGQLYRSDRLAINVIVDNIQGGISNCDIPYSDDMAQFVRDYDRLTRESSTSCQDLTDDGASIVGTSAVVGTELDYIVNQYTGIYNNPFLCWGRYKRHWWRTTLTISFQFHHAQMDGRQAAKFLERLQHAFNTVEP